jgi:hypothetical protein
MESFTTGFLHLNDRGAGYGKERDESPGAATLTMLSVWQRPSGRGRSTSSVGALMNAAFSGVTDPKTFAVVPLKACTDCRCEQARSNLRQGQRL